MDNRCFFRNGGKMAAFRRAEICGKTPGSVKAGAGEKTLRKSGRTAPAARSQKETVRIIESRKYHPADLLTIAPRCCRMKPHY